MIVFNTLNLHLLMLMRIINILCSKKNNKERIEYPKNNNAETVKKNIYETNLDTLSISL